MSELPEHDTNSDDMLRYKRLVFYSEEIDKINELLSDFLDSSQAKASLLVDVEGHMVTKMGYTKSLDTESLSALIAGSFASTRQVAHILGEKEFREIFHQGENDSIYISLIRERSMVVVVFDSRTTIGMVKFYLEELSKKVGKVMEEAEQKMESGEENEQDQLLDENFGDSVKDRLDDLFNL
jgi:predicted regulator of Ras-like GTPase activity (Roadblock/LC7/MglB family)